ncbi:terminase large subunit [Rhizobium chutanense]|uniref:Terminase large subunit n=1 Tax=Rhizobium chutanense TaxID=2035448 RepID=A0A432P3M9_9HYPH|nr:terminase large subunit [Rhizobium chutanense]RUM06806.1 terminase large subunit [Rhizobium chutanense]
MRYSTACPDWERRIVAGESLIPIEPLFPDEAQAALDVFKSLQITDLPQVFDRKTGQTRHPTFGESCEQFVFDFVAAVFGAYDEGSARRLIEEFFLLISKKNGKSTIVAGIMVTALIRNWRSHQELLILAPTREVAENSFGPAAAMIRADPELSVLLHVQDNVKSITHTITKAVLKIVSADSGTAAGKKAGFVLIDELWLFGKKAGAAGMLQEATGGLISRPEGFVIYISTQADAPPAGIFKQKLDYFRDVRDGKINDPQSLPVLYEFPDAMIASEAYLDPENWYVTNPNMGRSVRREWLERKMLNVRSGEDDEGDTYQGFLAKHLNVEIGMGLRANRWPGANHWAAAVDEELAALAPFDALERMLDRIDVAVVGADGGGLDDLFGLTIVGREPEELEVRIKVNGRETVVWMKRWLCWSHAWCHREVLIRRKKIAPVLLDFEKSGHLTIIDNALEDIAAIVDVVKMIKDRDLLASVAVDPAGIGDFVDALAMPEIDVTQDNGLLVGVPQGYAMMNAIKTAERRLSNKMLLHTGSPMMSWAVSNLKIEPTATAIRATKQTAGDAKIDPVMALFDAVTIMTKNPEPKKIRSVYEKRGLRVA